MPDLARLSKGKTSIISTLLEHNIIKAHVTRGTVDEMWSRTLPKYCQKRGFDLQALSRELERFLLRVRIHEEYPSDRTGRPDRKDIPNEDDWNAADLRDALNGVVLSKDSDFDPLGPLCVTPENFRQNALAYADLATMVSLIKAGGAMGLMLGFNGTKDFGSAAIAGWRNMPPAAQRTVAFGAVTLAVAILAHPKSRDAVVRVFRDHGRAIAGWGIEQAMIVAEKQAEVDTALSRAAPYYPSLEEVSC